MAAFFIRAPLCYFQLHGPASQIFLIELWRSSMQDFLSLMPQRSFPAHHLTFSYTKNVTHVAGSTLTVFMPTPL